VKSVAGGTQKKFGSWSKEGKKNGEGGEVTVFADLEEEVNKKGRSSPTNNGDSEGEITKREKKRDRNS